MTHDRRPTPAPQPKPPQDEPWADLGRFTAARIALARSGASLATTPLLEFRLAHARARDAVHAKLDAARLCETLTPLGLPVLTVASAAVLIGERPGLSAPDSMGAYLAFHPTAQTTDADRNCISNIRPEGLAYADAAFTLGHLLRAMRARRISGVQLKDDADRLLIEQR